MVRYIEIVMGIWNVIISVLIFISMLTIYQKDKLNKDVARACLNMMTVNMIFQMSDFLAWVFRGNTTFLGFIMTRVSNFVFFLGMAALPISVGMYALSLIRESDIGAGRKIQKLLIVVSAFMFSIDIINVFTGWVYGFDEQNRYFRAQTPLLYVLHGLCYFSIFTIHAIAWKYRKTEHKNILRMIRICCLFAEVVALYQSIFYGISAFNLAITAGMLFIFVATLQEQTLQLARRNEELVMSQKKLMDTKQKMLQLQIQPHFLFNSMAAIQALVLENQDQAYESIGTFSNLLRSGLHFSQVEGMVSVEEELNFVDSYAQLEILRFGENLDFDFDIQETGFNIPPLTIQPLVENAINHGLRPLRHMGTVTIRTYEELEKATIVIEVEDDGVGMGNDTVSEVKAKDRDHIGMDNVKARIEEGCRGSFEVISPVEPDRENGKRPGTLIRIRLPILQNRGE